MIIEENENRSHLKLQELESRYRKKSHIFLKIRLQNKQTKVSNLNIEIQQQTYKINTCEKVQKQKKNQKIIIIIIIV